MLNPTCIWQDGSLKILDHIACYSPELATTYAEFRLKHFQLYPYLYKGSLHAELESFKDFFTYDTAHLTILYHKNKAVGLASHLPMAQAFKNMQSPFDKTDFDFAKCYYYSESIIESEYRNKGISKIFHSFVMQQAQKMGFLYITAMTVQRETNHPLCPDDYRPFDTYMHHFGYEIVPNFQLSLRWPTMPHGHEEEHSLQFWQRAI